MSLSFNEIVAIMFGRRRTQGPLIAQMIEVQQRYDGDYVLPLPNMDEEPNSPNYGPLLVADSIEHLALKAASCSPNIDVPALDATAPSGRGSIEWASRRRRALHGTWHKNQLPLILRTAYKHFVGYATFSLLWMPDDDPKSRTYQMPKLVTRDPLCTFPEPKPSYDLTPPRNIGYVAAHSAEGILASWAHRLEDDKFRNLSALLNSTRRADSRMWDMVEWIDEDEIVLGILGPHYPEGTRSDWANQTPNSNASWTKGAFMELTRFPNKAGGVPAVCPTQVTMSKVASAVAKNVGQSDLLGRLMALNLAASERDIFPDRYIIGSSKNGGKTPRLIGADSWLDGRGGETNIIMDAEHVGQLHDTPGPAAQSSIERAERNFRVSTGLAPQWGSESYGAMRTGRGQDTLESYATDPRVAELHETMQLSLTEMNSCALRMYKGYWGPKKYSMYSGWAGDPGNVEFTPNTHFESTENVVSYPVLGADIQGLTIRLGQLFGAHAISLRTFRRRHPDIENADAEERQVHVEMLELACIDALAALVQGGTMPPEDLAKVGQLLSKDGNVFDAMVLASKLAQERQASVAQQPAPQVGPDGQPVQGALPPGAMPGLGAPGAGMEQQAPSPQIGPPGPSLENLRMITRDYKRPAGV